MKEREDVCQEKAVLEWAIKKKGMTREQFLKNWKLPEWKYFSDDYVAGFFWKFKTKNFFGWSFYNYDTEFYKVNPDVEFHNLDSYSKEIPDRVFENLTIARRCGAKDFQVGYPVMNKIQLFDPILVAKIEQEMFEIDFWE